MTTQRNYSLDLLRIIACLAVVMIHTAGSPILHGMVEEGSRHYLQCIAMDALCRWSVPVFAMLSGFFLLDPQKDVSIGRLFKKYLARIVAALVFWSFFYSLHFDLKTFSINPSGFYPLTTGTSHLWYLMMLIGLYLAIPVMRLIAASPKVLSFFCWAWAAFMLYRFAGKFVTLPIDPGEVIFTDYVGYCLVAYWLKQNLSRKGESKNLAAAIYILGAIGLVGSLAIGLSLGTPDTPFLSYTSPNVIAAAIGLFLLFVRNPLQLSAKWSNAVETCSKCTFGIYLMHVWVLSQFFFRVHRLIPQPIILSVVCVIATFAVSFALTFLIKKIPVAGRYLV